MAKRFLSIILAVFLLAGSGLGYAQTTTQTFSIGATVPARFALGAWLLEIDSMGTSDPTDDNFNLPTPASINFGTLVEDADGWGIYRPQAGHYFMVNLIASTSGRPYTIQHTMASTGNGDLDLALSATPVFSDALMMIITYPDLTTENKTNGDLGFTSVPTGASVGGPRLAVGDWPTYVSSSSGETLIVGEVWGLYDGDPASALKVAEPTATPLIVGVAQTGTVSGSVTYTLVPNF